MGRTPARRKQAQSLPELTAKRDEQVRAAYRVFETSVDGQAVLDDLCESYYDVSTFDPNPTVMARNEGRREVVLAIFEILDTLKDQKNRG